MQTCRMPEYGTVFSVRPTSLDTAIIQTDQNYTMSKKQTPMMFPNNANKCSQLQIMVGKKSRQVIFYICCLISLQQIGNSNNSDLFYH